MTHNSVSILALGFVLGLKHAIEADHLIAVTTLVTEHKNPFKSAFVGTFWGIGHTTTLFIIGLGILLLKISIPDQISLIFEIFVGIMLIFLGIRSIGIKRLLHTHKHDHDGKIHTHLHIDPHSHQKIKYHTRSFLVGMIHGIAGSGALMLLVLSTIDSLLWGVYYILLFGIGSVISMTISSFLLGLPLYFSTGKFTKLENWIRIIAGLVSIAFGVFLIIELTKELLHV